MDAITLATAEKVAEAAKDIYEAGKKVEQVCDVTKQMKNIADSEGKEQIKSVNRLTSTSVQTFTGSESKELGDNKSTSEVLKGGNLDLTEGELKIQNAPFDLVGDVFVEDAPDTLKTIDKFKDYPDFIEPADIGKAVDTLENLQNGAFVDEAPDSLKPVEQISNGLTNEEKLEIKNKTSWSDKIVDSIRSKEEAQIYIDAGLVEGEINGKPALIQPKIDGDAYNEPKWPDWSNKDMMGEGYPPRDQNGKSYELHHIGQNPESPLAELTYEQHHCDGNFKTLHTFEESSIDRMQFNKERQEYWIERSKTI